LESLAGINKKYSRLWEQPTDKSRGSNKGSGKGLGGVWGWHVTLDNLSNGRPEMWQHYYDMGIIEFLNLLLYYKDKEEYHAKIRALNNLRSGR